MKKPNSSVSLCTTQPTLSGIEAVCDKYNKTENVHNVTLKCVRETIIAVGKQEVLYTLSVSM